VNSEATQEILRDPHVFTMPPPDSCSSHSCPITHSVLHKSHFEIATRKAQLNHNFMVGGMCSVLITEWGHLEIQGLATLHYCRDKAGLVFMREDTYLHVLLLYRNLWVEVYS
jgi:hypothetical protein